MMLLLLTLVAAAPVNDPPPSDVEVPGDLAPVSEDAFDDLAVPGDDPSTDSAYDDMSLAELLDITVVTASGKAESITTAPANVTVFTSADIARYRWRSIGEILARVPGLHVIDDLVHPSISVRGVNGGLGSGTRLVKIMINGVEVSFRPDLTSFIGPEYIPIEAVDRVEIVKGPLSALYGANAFLATINVITKLSPQGAHAKSAARGTWQQSSPQGGYGVSGLATYGTDELDVLAAVTTDRLDRSGLRVRKTFEEQERDRFNQFFADRSRNDLALPSSGYGRISYTPGDLGNFVLQGGIQELNSKGEFLLNSVTTHASRINTYNVWSHLDHQRTWADFIDTHVGVGVSSGAPRGDTRLYLSAGDDRYYVPKYDYLAVDAVIEATATFEHFQVKLGADAIRDQQHVLLYRQVLLDGSPSGQDASDIVRSRVLTSAGTYLSLRANPIPGLEELNVTGNVRLDYLNYDARQEPLQVSWRFAAVYEHSEWFTAKVFAGRAFQGPSASLLFAEEGAFAFGNANNVIGQRTVARTLGEGFAAPLTPQISQSVEFVLGSTIAGLLQLELGGFFQDIENRIEFRSYGANFMASNVDAARFLGAEGSARFVWDRLSMRVAGSYMRQIPDENQPEWGAMPLFPEFQAFAALDVTVPEVFLQASVYGTIVGPRGSSAGNTLLNNLQPYTLPTWGDMDVSVSTLGLHVLGDSPTVLAFTMRNLLNTAYSEPAFGGFDVPNRGRWFMIELEQGF